MIPQKCTGYAQMGYYLTDLKINDLTGIKKSF